jgi:enoyl-CoA hydratase
MAAFEHIVVEQAEDLLRIRINRPEKRNALSRAVLSELASAFALHAGDTSLKAAVLTGAGDKAFAAGGDLREFATLRSERDAAELFTGAYRALEQVRRFPVPVIAALNGLAVGGGAELALACDFRVAAAHATLGFVQGRLNISTGFGGGTDLMRLVGASRGLLCALRAEVLNAAEARSAGLIDELAGEHESLEQCVMRFLEPIRRQVPQVIRSYKAMALAERQGLDAEQRFLAELAGFVDTWTHADHWTAADRVLAKASNQEQAK